MTKKKQMKENDILVIAAHRNIPLQKPCKASRENDFVATEKLSKGR
jgi:hypothetical protein